MSEPMTVTPDVIDKIIGLSGQIRPGAAVTPAGESDPLVMLPRDMRVESIKQFCPPQRIEQCVRLQEVESFCAYVNRFKTEDTLIFANVDSGCEFDAVLDYHGPAPDLKAHYCRHHARFTALETPEWTKLCEFDGSHMSQVAFAEFLENNAKIFRSPNGADLLELIRNLHAHKHARYQSAVRLDNGAHSLSYEEDIVVKSQNTTKAGSYELPTQIKVGASVFVGGEPLEITCRLKTRLQNREITLFYEIVGFADIVRESTLALVKQVNKSCGILPLLGSV